MSVDKYVSLRYIGGMPVKHDNINHNSGRIWNGKNSCVRVPIEEMEKYLVHYTDFELATPMFLQSPAAEALSTDDQIFALLSIVSNLEQNACEELQVALDSRMRELIDSGKEKIPVSSKDRPRMNDRRAKIVETIDEMDPTNRDHYTDTGRPRVSAVSELSGLGDVTSAEIYDVLRNQKAKTPAEVEPELGEVTTESEVEPIPPSIAKPSKAKG